MFTVVAIVVLHIYAESLLTWSDVQPLKACLFMGLLDIPGRRSRPPPEPPKMADYCRGTLSPNNS